MPDDPKPTPPPEPNPPVVITPGDLTRLIQHIDRRNEQEAQEQSKDEGKK